MRRILTMLFVSVFMLSLCPLHAQETETLVLIARSQLSSDHPAVENRPF